MKNIHIRFVQNDGGNWYNAVDQKLKDSTGLWVHTPISYYKRASNLGKILKRSGFKPESLKIGDVLTIKIPNDDGSDIETDFIIVKIVTNLAAAMSQKII